MTDFRQLPAEMLKEMKDTIDDPDYSDVNPCNCNLLFSLMIEVADNI